MDRSVVLSDAQLECLASPSRAETFSKLRAMGQASAREIAAELGKSPEAVHYHLKALGRAGLITEAYRRPAPKKPESVYECSAERYELPDPASSPRTASLIRRSVLAGLRDTMRGYEAAAIHAQNEPTSRRNLQVIRLNARLSQADSDTFQQMLETAVQFATANRADDGVRIQWSSLVFEVGPR